MSTGNYEVDWELPHTCLSESDAASQPEHCDPGCGSSAARRDQLQLRSYPRQAFAWNRLKSSMDDLAESAEPWSKEMFGVVRILQEAPRNHGNVSEVQVLVGASACKRAAVKKVPREFMKSSPDEFRKMRPTESEQPWMDLGLIKELNSLQCPFVCELMGLFSDGMYFYIVQELGTEGDLFTWSSKLTRSCSEREEQIRPIVVYTVPSKVMLALCLLRFN